MTTLIVAVAIVSLLLTVGAGFGSVSSFKREKAETQMIAFGFVCLICIIYLGWRA